MEETESLLNTLPMLSHPHSLWVPLIIAVINSIPSQSQLLSMTRAILRASRWEEAWIHFPVSPHAERNRLKLQCTWPDRFPLKWKHEDTFLLQSFHPKQILETNYKVNWQCCAGKCLSLHAKTLFVPVFIFFPARVNPLINIKWFVHVTAANIQGIYFVIPGIYMHSRKHAFFLAARLTLMLYYHFSGFRPEPLLQLYLMHLVNIQFHKDKKYVRTKTNSLTVCHWCLGWNCSIRLGSAWLSLVQRFPASHHSEAKYMYVCGKAW